jgi:hypothetical protein
MKPNFRKVVTVRRPAVPTGYVEVKAPRGNLRSDLKFLEACGWSGTSTCRLISESDWAKLQPKLEAAGYTLEYT